MPRLISLVAFFLVCAVTPARAEEPDELTELIHSTHIHGLAFEPSGGDWAFVATHNGLYTFDLETQAVAPLGNNRQDFMGFSVDPSGIFYGSGHPETGGNSGIIASHDGGESWTPLSEGVNGPVDFHQMTVSPADPATLYGAYAGGLQRSRDAGRTWELVGPAPDGLIDLTGSALDPDTLYAATEEGLLKSQDAGHTWTSAHPSPLPASFVETGPEGMVYAFVLDIGLVRASEEDLEWTVVSEPLGGEYFLHFATDGTRAIAVTGSGAMLISDTWGENWRILGR